MIVNLPTEAEIEAAKKAGAMPKNDKEKSETEAAKKAGAMPKNDKEMSEPIGA